MITEHEREAFALMLPGDGWTAVKSDTRGDTVTLTDGTTRATLQGGGGNISGWRRVIIDYGADLATGHGLGSDLGEAFSLARYHLCGQLWARYLADDSDHRARMLAET